MPVSFDGQKKTFFLDLPDTCPRCKTSIHPKPIWAAQNSYMFGDSDVTHGIAIFACAKCKLPFAAKLSAVNENINGVWSSSQLTPTTPTVREFPAETEEISEMFVEIYHQAQAAEAYNLNEIAGMGYRKALEFLIKDYATWSKPDDEDKILESRLGKCIEKYIDQPRIKATAIAATWIGNDETHYMREWEDKDISDLKKFIDACLYYIIAEVSSASAEAMISSDS